MNKTLEEEIKEKVKKILESDKNFNINIEEKIIKNKRNINFEKIDTLVFSGGGIKGIHYIGILKRLEELNILKNITSLAGTSVGALFIVLITIGFTSTELTEFLSLFNLNKIKNISNINSFLSLFTTPFSPLKLLNLSFYRWSRAC